MVRIIHRNNNGNILYHDEGPNKQPAVLQQKNRQDVQVQEIGGSYNLQKRDSSEDKKYPNLFSLPPVPQNNVITKTITPPMNPIQLSSNVRSEKSQIQAPQSLSFDTIPPASDAGGLLNIMTQRLQHLESQMLSLNDHKIAQINNSLHAQEQHLSTLDGYLEDMASLSRRDDQLLKNEVMQALAASISSLKDQLMNQVIQLHEQRLSSFHDQNQSSIDQIHQSVIETKQTQITIDHRLQSLEEKHQQDQSRIQQMMEQIAQKLNESMTNLEEVKNHPNTDINQLSTLVSGNIASQTQELVQHHLQTFQAQFNTQWQQQLDNVLQTTQQRVSSQLERDMSSFVSHQLPTQIHQLVEQRLSPWQEKGRRQEESQQQLLVAMQTTQQLIDSMRKETQKKLDTVSQSINETKKDTLIQCQLMIHELRKEMYRANATPSSRADWK